MVSSKVYIYDLYILINSDFLWNFFGGNFLVITIIIVLLYVVGDLLCWYIGPYGDVHT